MLRHTFLISLITSTLISFGQDRQIMLQIDTLNLNGCDHFGVVLTSPGDAITPDFINDSVCVMNSIGYPNFVCPLTLKNESTEIQITLDDQGGYLSLMEAYQYKHDTIKIHTLNIIKNNYRDNTYTCIDYCQIKTDGSLDTPYKTRTSKTIEQRTKRFDFVFKTAYHINDELYLVSIQKQKGAEEHSMFHAFKPKKYAKHPDNYKGKTTYLSGLSTTTHYINVVRLKLKTTF